MKKILCLLLAMTFITSIAMIGVNAKETEKFTTYTTKLNKLIYVDTETNKEYEYLTTGKNSDGTEFLLMNWYGGVSDEKYYQIIGDYLLINPHTVGECQGPFFIIKNNNIFGVTEAFENGLIEDDAFYTAMQNTSHKKRLKLLGDTNDDGIVNVMDATFIQNKLANEPNYYTTRDAIILNYHSIAYYNHIADFNVDNTINVMDATAIQKALVGLN